MAAIVLPELPAGFTPSFVTSLLSSTGVLSEDTEVTGVRLEPVGEGSGMMSDLARLHLTYNQADAALPSTLVAKFAAQNETNREVAMSFNLYERETRYFAELDPLTTACSPKTLFSERQGDNFLILMEDMSAYRVGDQRAGADLTDTEAMTDELAKLHAAFWGQTDKIEWIPGIADSYHATNMANFIQVGWPNMTTLFADFIDPAIVARGDAFIAALPALQQAMHTAPITLLHGDFRMENVFFATRPDHQGVAICDWQGPLQGRGVVDLALMLGQSTRTEVRRSHEERLVERYAAGLAELGVSGYSAAQAWDDYQLALLYNWVYVGVVAGTLDASDERAFAWMSQMVARQSAASLDLDVFRLLPGPAASAN